MRDIRLQEMEKVIRDAGTISMEDLCRRFDVSMHTVRRDVAELEKRGAVGKIYGGVTAIENSRNLLPNYMERAVINADQKRACCAAAAALVRDRDVIFVDSGTTLSSLPEYLADRQGVTIVTHSLTVAQSAFPYENLDVIMLPGTLRRKTLSLTGAETVSALRKYNIRKAFMATTGTTERTVTNSSPNEFEIKQAAVAGIPERILVLTGDKFGHAGLMNYAAFSEFQTIVTDRLPPEPWLSALRESGAELISAEEP